MKNKVAESKSSGTLLYQRFPKWLLAAILYGISWSYFAGLNLSFIAWFAFVPLFIDLENRNTFRAFYSRALLFSSVAYFIICHGFLFTARVHYFIFIGAADELFLTSISFALIYPFKKRYGFKTALMIFPFVISLWEWLYQQFEHTTGYLMLSNSQCRNTWFIQYIDLFGVWSIGCWVMLFNVRLFFQYKKLLVNPKSPAVKKKFVWICLAMLVPPLLYFAFKHWQYDAKPGKQINITMINSQFTIWDSSPERWANKIERLTFLTDSIDYELHSTVRGGESYTTFSSAVAEREGGLKSKRLKSDLYVWSEGAIDYGNDTTVTHFINTAINDWQTPLLTGMQFIPEDAAKDDFRRVNRAALFDNDSQNKNNFYDKQRLFPIREKIPYHELLAKTFYLPYKINDPSFLKEGTGINLIDLKIENKRKVKIGTPICQEQNYPEIWSEMAVKGAECFVQLSFESWWYLDYFKKQMADITRLRCIETRRCAARCSNGGVTSFIDAMGKIYSPAEKKEGVTKANLSIDNDVSFFSNHQYLFLLMCLLMVFAFIVHSELRQSHECKIKFLRKKYI